MFDLGGQLAHLPAVEAGDLIVIIMMALTTIKNSSYYY